MSAPSSAAAPATLNNSFCALGADDVTRLVSAIEARTPPVRALLLEGCNLDGDSVVRLAAALARAYERAPSALVTATATVKLPMLALDLENNACDDASCAALARDVITQCQLHTLRLAHNEAIGDAGAAALAAALAADGCSLQHLALDACSVCDAGARALASALLANTSLHTLRLGCNAGITDAGACALAATVWPPDGATLSTPPPPCALQHLDLRGCTGITETGIAMLIAAVQARNASVGATTTPPSFEYRGPGDQQLAAPSCALHESYSDDEDENADGGAASECDSNASGEEATAGAALPPYASQLYRSDDDHSGDDGSDNADLDYQRMLAAVALADFDGDAEYDDEK